VDGCSYFVLIIEQTRVNEGPGFPGPSS
jgi:hypothetical protein